MAARRVAGRVVEERMAAVWAEEVSVAWRAAKGVVRDAAKEAVAREG